MIIYLDNCDTRLSNSFLVLIPDPNEWYPFSMSTIVIDDLKQDTGLDDWLSRLSHLTKQVADWIASEPGWSVEAGETVITEDATGTYTAPTLTIKTDTGKAILEPIALVGFGVRGIVELYAWPTLYRVRLLMQDDSDQWDVLTDSGIRLRQPWKREPFIDLVRDLVAA
jgi:hypothetical protein